MNDIAQTNLAEPAPVDWDNYAKSGFQVPPDALDAAGKPIIYYGIVEKAVVSDPDTLSGAPLLNFLLDPIVVTGEGPGKGYSIRFTRTSVRPYTTKQADGSFLPKKGNPNPLADFLRATGSQVKPQTNDQYVACVQQAVQLKRVFGFTLDWEAYNRDTGEKVKGFQAFPVDPTTGKRKAILKAGDFYAVVDGKGAPTGEQKQVTSEVLFANARLKFYRSTK